MSYDYTTTYSITESGPETASLAGQAQFDSPNYGCGYDCGWGCKGPCASVRYEAGPDRQEADDDDSETASSTTLFSVNDEEALVEEGQHQHTDGDETSELLDHETPEEDHVQVASPEWRDTSHPPSEDFDDRSESLDVEPCASGDHSNAPSSRGTMGTQSPMPEVGYWLEGLPPIQLPPVQLPSIYLFLKSPLRLNPQCRGHPTDMTYLDDGGDWRS